MRMMSPDSGRMSSPRISRRMRIDLRRVMVREERKCFVCYVNFYFILIIVFGMNK
jgi:hypothetical protein